MQSTFERLFSMNTYQNRIFTFLQGNGTRKGNGACACDKDYIGAMCNDCAKMHFEAYRDDNKVLCSACHKSCQNSCSGAGPKSRFQILPIIASTQLHWEKIQQTANHATKDGKWTTMVVMTVSRFFC